MTDWKKFFARIYERSANDPSTWLRNARSLKKSANLVFEESLKTERNALTTPTDEHISRSPILWPVYMMLVGLSIENLIKGIYISENGAFETETLKLKKVLTFHEKHKKRLLDQTKVRLQKEQYVLMERLEQYVKSWGRYGIEKSF